METYTFVSADGELKLTVKTEFLKVEPSPEKCEALDLFAEKNIAQYLHNPTGPALVHIPNNHEEFFIDGSACSKEEAERIKHTMGFNTKLDKLLE